MLTTNDGVSVVAAHSSQFTVELSIKSAILAKGTFFLTACHKVASHVNVASFS